MLNQRGNYSSGDDFVLEYGELRFTFNERDFAERCEQAARKLGFVGGRLEDEEAEDLVNLVVNGEVHDPASALGEHVNDCWPELVGPSERSLVHWLRRLIFRSAWLDQRVKEGELDVAFDERHAHLLLRAARSRQRADRAGSRALLGPGGLPAALTRGRCHPNGSYSAACSRTASAIAAAPASPTSSSGRSVPLASRSSAGKRRGAGLLRRRARRPSSRRRAAPRRSRSPSASRRRRCCARPRAPCAPRAGGDRRACRSARRRRRRAPRRACRGRSRARPPAPARRPRRRS